MQKFKQFIETAKGTLCDKEFLNKFIDDMYLFRSHTLCGIKDVNSVHLGMTRLAAKMHGFKNSDMVIGTTDYQSLCKVAESANSLIKQDKNVVQTKLPKYILDFHEFACGLKSFLTTKHYIINPNTDHVLGTFWVACNLQINNNLKIILDVHEAKFGKHHSIEILTHPDKFELTSLERDVLLCICLGINNRKDIADFLSKIYRKPINHETTIGDAIRRLYRKLNCNTHYQLIEFAVYNNMHLEIPQAFLPTGSYLIKK